MQSTANDELTYLQQGDPNRLDILTRLPALFQKVLSGYKEIMKYGMPWYQKNGAGEVGFTSQKYCIFLNIFKQDVILAKRALLQGLRVSKGCIRVSSPKNMDLNVIRKLLVDTANSSETFC